LLTEEAVKAIDEGHTSVIQERKEFIDKFDDLQHNGQSLLMVAITKNNLEVVKYLIGEKVDINFRVSIKESDMFFERNDISEYLVKFMPKE
jgi:ankyrin repeat protein